MKSDIKPDQYLSELLVNVYSYRVIVKCLAVVFVDFLKSSHILYMCAYTL